jgi:O-antigen ligase
MNEVRSVKGVRRLRDILLGIMLLVVVGALGFFLAELVMSPNWPNAVRLVGLSAVLLTILMSPANGLLLWVILEPYTQFWYLNVKMPAGIPDLSLSRLAISLLSIVWVAQLATGKRRIRRPSATEISIIVFCIMAVPSLTAGLDGLRGTIQMFFDKFIVPFLVLVLAKNFYDRETGLDRLVAALAVIGFYLSFMVFYEQLTGQPLFYQLGRATVYSRSLRKIVSLLGNPAYLGTALGMIVPIAFFKFVRQASPYGRLFYGILLLMAVLGNFFCYNRGAWLALAVALLVMLLFERDYRRILLPIALVAIAVGIVYWPTISNSPVIKERLYSVGSIEYRAVMLDMSKRLLRNHLFLGVGFDNFAYYYLYYGGPWSILGHSLPSPHNAFLLVLTTMGLIAFIPYLWIFFSMFLEIASVLRRSRKDTRVDRALLVAGWAVIAVYVVSAAFVDLYYSTFNSLVFFFIMGTLLGHLYCLRVVPPSQTAAE